MDSDGLCIRSESTFFVIREWLRKNPRSLTFLVWLMKEIFTSIPPFVGVTSKLHVLLVDLVPKKTHYTCKKYSNFIFFNFKNLAVITSLFSSFFLVNNFFYTMGNSCFCTFLFYLIYDCNKIEKWLYSSVGLNSDYSGAQRLLSQHWRVDFIKCFIKMWLHERAKCKNGCLERFVLLKFTLWCVIFSDTDKRKTLFWESVGHTLKVSVDSWRIFLMQRV